MSGIGGYVKGALAGGFAGAVGGALVGAVIAGASLLFAGATGGLSVAAGMVVGEALGGALLGAMALAPLGAIAGLVTGVMKSREQNQPSASDVVGIAKVAYSRGLQSGVNLGVRLEHEHHKQQGCMVEREESRRTAKTTMPEHHSLQ